MALQNPPENAERYIGIISWADGKLPTQVFGTGLQASSALRYIASSQNLVPTTSLH